MTETIQVMKINTDTSNQTDPVQFILEYFSQLKNTIDCEVQKLISKNLKSNVHGDHLADVVYKHHDNVIYEVNKQEQICLSKKEILTRSQTTIFLNREFFETIKGFSCEDWFFGKLISIDDEHFDERIIQTIK